jgi:hypothetical protein
MYQSNMMEWIPPRCPVCGGSGWVRAASISTHSSYHAVGRVALWAYAVVVPCFACEGAQMLEPTPAPSATARPSP